MPAIDITQECPDTPDARVLIDELDAYVRPLYPPSSDHGYTVEALISQEVAFFVLREDGVPAGCGGIQLFGTEYGELKRMYVRPEYRGRGYAERLLSRLEEHARQQGVHLLRLETGIHQHAALAFYERLGFRSIPPFGAYQEDPLSRFYEKHCGDPG